tara:strand:+ start:1700 stop:2332 length:633 start_codon:yes stop_codon:yes gene_type:complete
MKITPSIFLFATILAVTPASGQNSGDLPEPIAPPTSETIPETAKAEPSPELASIDFLERSKFIAAKIQKNPRQVDPFGMFMDPTNANERLNLADQYSEIEETPVLNNSSLKSALETLPISGVYPTQKVVVLGARTLNLGGQFGMKLQDLTIRLRFEGIRGDSIYFKDMDTQEVASVEFNPLPKEFEPIDRNSTQVMGQGIIPMNELFIVN